MTLRKIEVIPYDYSWAKNFTTEVKKIRKALDENCIAIHHIGSTSVPGLAAKPILDIVPVVKDITKVDIKNDKMLALGYEARGEYGILFRRYFQKGGNTKTHNVHIFEEGNPEIDRYLKFRDWMQNNPQDREIYSKLKQELAKQYPNDIIAYTIGKDEFITEIDKKAGWNGYRIVMAATPEEWGFYHSIKETEIFARNNIQYDRNHPTLTAENHFHFILYKGQNIVCAAQIEFLNNNQSVLRFLATKQQFKNLGFGKHMMQLLEKWVKQQGHIVIKMHAHLEAELFFRNLGYKEIKFDNPSISKSILDLGKSLEDFCDQEQ